MDEPQTSDRRDRAHPTRRVVHRAGAAVMAAGTLAVVGGFVAPSASAVIELEPDPGATVVAGCGVSSGELSITLTNTDGLADAHFTVAVSEFAPTDHLVAPGGSEAYALTGLGDGFGGVVTITADFGEVVQQAFGPFECNSYAAQLTARCSGTEAFLDLHVDRTAGNAGTVYLVVDHDVVAQQTPSPTWDTSIGVPTDVALDVAVTNYSEGLLAERTEPVSCPLAEVVAATTGTTNLADARGEQVEMAALARVAVPVAATLPVTGAPTGVIAVGGGLLVTAGFGAWSLARRQRRENLS